MLLVGALLSSVGLAVVVLVPLVVGVVLVRKQGRRRLAGATCLVWSVGLVALVLFNLLT